jgi:hypothetical protein
MSQRVALVYFRGKRCSQLVMWEGALPEILHRLQPYIFGSYCRGYQGEVVLGVVGGEAHRTRRSYESATYPLWSPEKEGRRPTPSVRCRCYPESTSGKSPPS